MLEKNRQDKWGGGHICNGAAMVCFCEEVAFEQGLKGAGGGSRVDTREEFQAEGTANAKAQG